MHAFWSDAEVMRYFPRTLDEEAMRAWIERNLKRYEQYGYGLWAVILKETHVNSLAIAA
jgi:RimJ/RimL family protein N-acetyltransferase